MWAVIANDCRVQGGTYYILVILVTRNSWNWKKKPWLEDIWNRFWKIHVFEVVQVNRVAVLGVVLSVVTSKTFQRRSFRSPISCEPQCIRIWRVSGHTCCRICRGRCGCCGRCCTFCCVKKIQVYYRLWNTPKKLIYLLIWT